MQLKIRRSQRDSGVMSSTVVFCLDVRIELTSSERQNVQRYKLYNQVIYNSEASRRHLDKAAAQQDGSTMGSVKGLASIALAAMRLNVTVKSLERGQHIECKSMDEVIGAENAIMTACQNLKEYLETASQFDGTEHVVDFATETPTLVAQARPADTLVEPHVPHPEAAPAHDEFEQTFGTPAYDSMYDGPGGAEGLGQDIRETIDALRDGRPLTPHQWKILAAAAGIFIILLLLIFR